RSRRRAALHSTHRQRQRPSCASGAVGHSQRRLRVSQVQEAVRPGTEVPENLRLFAHALVESAAATLAAALGRPISTNTPTIAQVRADDLLEGTPLPWVVAEIPYQRGLNGRHWLVLSEAAAQALRGGEAGGGELDATALASVKTAIDQIFTAAGPAPVPRFAKPVAFCPAMLSLVNDPAQPPRPLGAARPAGALRGAAAARAR